MPQPPYQVDQLQIKPGAAGTRLIDRNSTDGSLQFTDPNVTAALTLLKLAGLRNLTGLFIVGRAGDGSPYTTVQSAIDALPNTSSVIAPSVVLINSGVYTEDITVSKDGVWLVGLGGVTLRNNSAGPTISIEDAATTTPENVRLQDLRIENTEDGEACVLIDGAGTYATGSITVSTAPLTASDTITLGGVVLTGVAGTRTSGSDDFSVDGLTTAAVAVEIAAAINDSANSFTALVVADPVVAVVDLTSVVAGTPGNAVTLAEASTGLMVSGATLTGGSSAGSAVAAGEVALIDCEMVAEGVGSFQISADTVNNIRVLGGSWRGSSTTSLSRISQCASFLLHNVEWVNDMEFAYDSGNPQPQELTSVYEMTGCRRVQNILSNQVGVGSLLIAYCHEVGNLTAGGDTSVQVWHSRTGNLSLEDTVAALYIEAFHGTPSVAGGTPTLWESVSVFTVSFAASASEGVTFPIPAPDANYGVFVDSPDPVAVPQATVKTAAGFTLTATAPITGTVYVVVARTT